jgi:hypothetical protein
MHVIRESGNSTLFDRAYPGGTTWVSQSTISSDSSIESIVDAPNCANSLSTKSRSASSQRDHSPNLLEGDGQRIMSVRATKSVDRDGNDDLGQASSGAADHSAPRPVHGDLHDAETVSLLSRH